MKRMLFLLLSLAVLLCGCAGNLPESTPSSLPVIADPPAASEPEKEDPPAVSSEESTVEESSVPEEPVFDAIALAESLSLEERVGQMFLARCPDRDAVEDVKEYHLGGYVLFNRDFEGETPDTVTATIAEYQSAADIPLLIAVDEEGGPVTRVSHHAAFRERKFYSPRWQYSQGGMDLVLQTEEEKCEFLKALGINVNLAPVCDITTDPNAFMYDRSIGLSPEETAFFVAETVKIMDGNFLGGVLKHFPGYGNNADTHIGIAVDDRSLETLENNDLVPFAAGIEAGCDAIMVSHTFINAIDPEFPATLSPKVHAYLREEMGFAGVIVTDDLVMEAVTDLYGAEEAAVLAVLAGNDLLCSSEYRKQYPAVLEAVQNGRIPESVVTAAAARVLQWKYELGLLE